MKRLLVDTNAIVDVLSRDPVWFEWSAATLTRCAAVGPLAVNPIIHAELAVGFPRIEVLDAALPKPDRLMLPLPWSAGFLARRVLQTYRHRGGARSSPLRDFYVGTHAAVDDLVVLTRDAARYRTYFPKLRIVAPRIGGGP